MRVRLTRTVRFTLRPRDLSGSSTDAPRDNTFASWPPPTGLGPWYEIDVHVEGEPDPGTGYLMGIQEIDQLTRAIALPILEEAFREAPHTRPSALLERIGRALENELGELLHSLCWKLTPRQSLAWRRRTKPNSTPEGAKTMTANHGPAILLKDRFEFSAAHRLHCPDRSDEWNRERFGKCNNPRGHGHNYEVEVAVETPVLDDGTTRVTLETLESLVNEEIVSRFDHRYLNLDCPEFEDRNPSVENIAITCHDLLKDRILEAGGALVTVTVWETGKTSCTYPAVALA